MAQPYVGQIMLFAGNFAPAGWMTCSGQTLPISEYATLFNLIGTTYGGDGQSTFVLPDLRGRAPVHMGQGAGLSNYVLGQVGGSENVTVTTSQIPAHNHIPTAVASAGNQSIPVTNGVLSNENSNAPGTGNAYTYYPSGSAQTAMANSSIANAGGSQPHQNVQPVLTLTIIISLFGVFPTPN